jgi:DNA polymerase II large subunit
MTAASEDMQNYFDSINEHVKTEYEIAVKARQKGLDPVDEVEVSLAKNMAERVLGLISTVAPQIKNSNLVPRIQELEVQYGALDWRVAFKIAEEVGKQEICKFETEREAIEVGIRTGFAYVTVGVVSACLEGFTKLEICKTREGKNYLSLYFSGPIRNAGGTAAAVCVLIADYVRKKMGYAQYDPTEAEINRVNTEIQDYHERITNLQYFPSKREIMFLVEHMPIEVNGEPTDQIEVSNYKNLPRIATNMLRGGYCLIYSSCIPLKAPKLWKQLNAWGKDFDMDQWNFLADFIKIQKEEAAKGTGGMDKKSEGDKEAKIKPVYTYIADLVAGRPVFAHPLQKGAFRLRYGRSRCSGDSGQSIHPAAMYVLNKAIAIGTQLKVERPGKGAVFTSCSSVEGPIVKLDTGDVLMVDSVDEARRYKDRIKEILFLGDVLICYGDFFNRAHVLVPPGYCEEWWVQELEKAIVDTFGSLDVAKLAGLADIDEQRLKQMLADPYIVSGAEAVQISKAVPVPLHPKYTYHWKDISKEELSTLTNWLKNSQVKTDPELNKIVTKIIVPKDDAGKRVLEILGVPHVMATEFVVIEKGDAIAFFAQFGNFEFEKFTTEGIDAFEIIEKISTVKIRDKSGIYIGSRMGRPEKAKMRKLKGSPHGLFPVGEQGGRMRAFRSCLAAGKVSSTFPLFKCASCNSTTIYPICENCGSKCTRTWYCKQCGEISAPCSHKSGPCSERSIDIKHYFDNALNILGMDPGMFPDLIKGIKGTINNEHMLEHLSKSILRAKYDVAVNKDGTIRYDCTELPLTHFKPREVAVSFERLRTLGYTKDIHGKELESEEQIVELKPQDIVLPCCPDIEEPCDKVLLQITAFIDELLQKLYGLPAYYNCRTREDLVGHLMIALAPHTSAGTVARIVGFSKNQGLMAHPLMHSALRRDCVYPTTKFAYSDNGNFNYKQIGPFVENLIKKGAKTKLIDSFGTERVEIDNEIYAFGLDPKTKKAVRKKIKYFVKAKAPEKWIKIRTATGREQIMTPRHKFIYLDKHKNFKIKPAGEIKIGDRLAVLKNLTFGSKLKELSLVKLLLGNLPENKQKEVIISGCADFFKKLIKQTDRKNILSVLNLSNNLKRNLSKWYSAVPLNNLNELINAKILCIEDIPSTAFIRTNFCSKRWPLTLDLSSELMSILGYYSSEGHSRQTKTVSQVCFRIMSREMQAHLIACIKHVFGLNPSLGENRTKISICSKLVYFLFEYCFKAGSTAYKKKVPEMLYNCSDDLIMSYLSAYFDGDGTIIYNKQKKWICFYSVNKELLDGVSLLLCRFGLIGRFSKTKERLPGRKVLERYRELGKQPKSHILHHLNYSSSDFYQLSKLLKPEKISKRNSIRSVDYLNQSRARRLKIGQNYADLEEQGDMFVDFVKHIEVFKDNKNAYCFEVEWKSEEEKNVLWGEQIINARCDGDEAGIFMLLDGLLNFSKKFLPGSRGSTMDAPLVLTSTLVPSEVDDMVFDMDTAWKYPLEFYEACLKYKMPWEVKIEQVNKRLGKPEQYEGYGFTHDNIDFNRGVLVSSYKTLASMEEKLSSQMDLAERIRAVNTSDVAALVINKHFIKDIKGNLRKFSQQEFRCVECNCKFRRPPLVGKCTSCGGKIIFTISEGSVIKYFQPSMDLAEKYNLPTYLKQTLAITQARIESEFGKDKEKQEALKKWF